MRIAVVSQQYAPASHGGIGTQTRCKANGLAARGHSVCVLTQSRDGQHRVDREGQVDVVCLPGSPACLQAQTEAVQWLAQSMSVAAALAELNHEHPFDMIDFAEWGSEGYVYLLNRQVWNYTPAVIQLHGPMAMLAETIGWPDRDSEFYRVGLHMEETCLRLADAVYSSSRCSAQWCQRRYGLDTSRVPILHTGVDTDHFRPLDTEKSSRPTIIFVGKAVKNKGVETLAEAACRLNSEIPDLRLQMIGSGEMAVWDRVVSIVRAAGCERMLERRGIVEHDQLPQFLSRAHVFAAPSVYEGGPGFVYLEAMACGLPAIACEDSGAAEVIESGDNGFLVPPNDVDSLTEVLRRLLADEALRINMGQRARDYVEKHANTENCLDRLESFYLKVAACGRKAES